MTIINQTALRYLEQMKQSGQTVNLAEEWKAGRLQDSEQGVEIKAKLKAWMETPEYEVWLSEDAKRLAEIKEKSKNLEQSASQKDLRGNLSEMANAIDAETREISGTDKTANVASDALREEKERYANVFNEVSGNFKDGLKNKGTMYANQTELYADEIDYDTINKMMDSYDALGEELKTRYAGEELETYQNALDEAYNDAFENNILNPIKHVFDEKFYQLSSQNPLGSGTAISMTDKDALTRRIGDIMAYEAEKSHRNAALEAGTKGFYDLLSDKEAWHDRVKVNDTIRESVGNYSTVKPTYMNDGALAAAKEAANKIAKELSDKVAEKYAYNPDKFKSEYEKATKFDGDAKTLFSMESVIRQAGGWYTFDFSKVENADAIWAKFLEDTKPQNG